MSGRVVPITLLQAISPSYDAIDADELSYPNLKKTIQRFYPFQLENFDGFLEERVNSEAEQDGDLSHEYLLIIAQRIQEAAHPAEKELWTRRYTEASIKVYGRPRADEVAAIASMELDYFEDALEILGGPGYLVDPLIEEYSALAGKAAPSRSLEERYCRLLAKLKEHYLLTYQPVFECFSQLDDEECLTPPQIRSLFEKALNVLKDYDPAWTEWSIDWHESATLSVDVTRKCIYVGRCRPPMPCTLVKGLFAHEVLVHAQRAINGAKIDSNLAVGLPGYLEAEEGFGVLVESAINNQVSPKVKDRYIDTALALGTENKPPMNRRELFAFAYSRAVVRNLINDKVFDVEQQKFLTWVHINRVYRGTLGNNHIGVFTKDIAYYNGFCKIANYLTDQLERGKPIRESVQYMLQGKFDPCKKRHLTYLRNHA